MFNLVSLKWVVMGSGGCDGTQVKTGGRLGKEKKKEATMRANI